MKNKDLKNISCWIVSEGMAGTENQCVAVAEALGVSYKKPSFRLNQPWKTLSPYLGFESCLTFNARDLKPPWPGLVIASGRKSIAVSRYIKRKSGGKTFTVQIQDPRVNPSQFDLVAVPHHDPTRGENVIVTDAAPNRITADGLKMAQAEFPHLADIKKPRVAVLIGGNSKAYKLTSDVTAQLAQNILSLDAGIMVTTSRRTGLKNENIIKEALLQNADTALRDLKGDQQWRGKDIFMHNGHRPNPYVAMLGYADFILVTADSASMISDACSTGKPVYMINLEGGHPRIDKLHNHLIDKGVLRVFEGDLESYTYEPLKDAEIIAAAIKERMML